MKHFKVIPLIMCCLLLAFSAKAQDTSLYPFRIGAQAGVNLSNTTKSDYDMKAGLNVGVTVDYVLSENFFLRSGLSFMMKGAKLNKDYEVSVSTDPVVSHVKKSARLNYLQLPIMVGYRYPIAMDTYIYISAGPYFAVGVYGKGTSKITQSIITDESPNNTIFNDKYDSFNDLDMKPVDLGLVANIGAEYSNWSFNIGYEYGLLNINKSKLSAVPFTPEAFTNSDSWHNITGTFTIGYKY